MVRRVIPDMSNRFFILLCVIGIVFSLGLIQLITLGEAGRFRKVKEPTDIQVGAHILDTYGVKTWKLWHEQKAIKRERERLNSVQYYRMLED